VTDGLAGEVRAAVRRRHGELHELAAELVRRPSLLGAEADAQRLVADRLAAAGFSVEQVEPDAEAALAAPYAGYPSLPYDGRASVETVASKRFL